MQLPHTLIPYSRALFLLSDSARKRVHRKLYWTPTQRILWTLQDTRQALMLVKVIDPFTLEILPKVNAELGYTSTDIISIDKNEIADDIKSYYADFSQGELLEEYDAHGELVLAFMGEIKELTKGRISKKSLRFASLLPCDKVIIRDTGVHLIREGSWQAIVKYRYLQHYRPYKGPEKPPILTPRSPGIP